MRDENSVYAMMTEDCYERTTFLVIPEGEGFMLQAVENRALPTNDIDGWCASLWRPYKCHCCTGQYT